VQAFTQGEQVVARLETGEELFEKLAELAKSHGVKAGVVVLGIGMLSRATLGYWNGREYATRELLRPHELVALHGTIAEVDGVPSLHLHAGLAGPDHELVGGHLMRGTVGALVELYVQRFPGHTFGRPLDESLGLRRLDLHPGPSPPV
jgi:hypothetical protein